jgi:ligand-binding SRPBCC domain-containing protein
VSPPSSYSHSFTLPAGLEATFRLFSDPGLLDSLTPSWFRLKPTSPVSLPLAPGIEISYRLRWRGLPLRWISRVVEWKPPHLLTYEQVRGPYRLFRHEHRFETEETGTRVFDRVIYRAPGGRPIRSFVVRPDLEKIFRHRERAARRALEGRISTSRAQAALDRRLAAGAWELQEDTARVEAGSFMPRTSASSSAMEPPT